MKKRGKIYIKRKGDKECEELKKGEKVFGIYKRKIFKSSLVASHHTGKYGENSQLRGCQMIQGIT